VGQFSFSHKITDVLVGAYELNYAESTIFRLHFYRRHYESSFSNGLTYLAPKATASCKISQGIAITLFKVIQGTTFCMNQKPVGDFLLVNDTNLNILARTVSMSQSICYFFCRAQWIAVFNALVRCE